jgi:outer membrane protein OmpA-like peptidoglycan-associated protein
MRHVLQSCCATLALVLASSAWAQVPELTAPQRRITDEALYHDNTVYQVYEERLKDLNARGHRVSDYDMAKAQCWVDVSFHEYSRNDRSPFPAEALGQAEAIIEALENNTTPASRDTPLINDATRLRPDLWQRIAEIKAGPQLECAAEALACGEVELVHAGNEYKQFGWRHANPYVGMAEDAIDEASAQAAHCQPPPPPLVPAPAAKVTTERLVVRTDALFLFGRSDYAGLTEGGRATLDNLIGAMPKPDAVTSVSVVGYTDRIDVHHDPSHNQRLSEARAQTVATYLTQHGIDKAHITSEGRGAANALVSCSQADKKALYACLAPNRRVEIVVTSSTMP